MSLKKSLIQLIRMIYFLFVQLESAKFLLTIILKVIINHFHDAVFYSKAKTEMDIKNMISVVLFFYKNRSPFTAYIYSQWVKFNITSYAMVGVPKILKFVSIWLRIHS